MHARLFAIGLAVSLGSAGCASHPSWQSDSAKFHLVLDVGSSGTSLCLFGMQTGPGCRMNPNPPVCTRVRGGLASLAQGKTPEQIESMVQNYLRPAWHALLGAQHGKNWDARTQIVAAAALGTGGFRDAKTGEQLDRPEWTVLWHSLSQFLRKEAHLASVVARPLLGTEEGQLAWHGVRASQRPEESFAIMEVGGATVQLALADAPLEKTNVVAVSDPVGQDRTFTHFTREAPTPEFEVCYRPNERHKQNGRACVDFLWDRVFAASRVANLAAVSPPRRVYALGQPWLGLLRELPTSPPWTQKKKRDLPSRARLSDLLLLADWACQKTDAELQAIAPHSYEAKRGAGRTCYSVAYHAAYFLAIQALSRNGEVIPGGDEQWARGAAVSDQFFPDCRTP